MVYGYSGSCFVDNANIHYLRNGYCVRLLSVYSFFMETGLWVPGGGNGALIRSDVYRMLLWMDVGAC